ncbi:MAG: hypothetical protein ACOC1K_02010 [Nanoarchaeota archaeon]
MRVEYEINKLKEKMGCLESEIDKLEELVKSVQTKRILEEIKKVETEIIRVENLLNEKCVNILIKLWRKIKCKDIV